MVDIGRFVVSRRGIFQGAILAGAFVASVTPTPTPTPTPSPTPTDTPTPTPTVSPAAPPTLEPSEWVTSKCFDEAWSTEAIASFPQFVAVTNATEAFDCRVIWDSRIFEVAPAVLAVTSDVREVDHELLESGVLLLHVPAGTTALLFNVAGVNLYPNENIGTPRDTLFEIVDSANVLASVPVPATTAACSPWALEIEAEWTTLDGVIVPLAVRMISKGPNPVPANSAVDVVTAASIDPAFAVPSAGIAVSNDVGGGQVTFHAHVVQGIAMDSLETLVFPFEAADSIPERNPSIISCVLHHFSSDTTGMRITNKATAYPVTESGLPVSSFEPEPTA